VRRALTTAAAGAVLLAPSALAGEPPTVRFLVDRPAVSLGDPFHYTVEARSAAGEPLQVIADTAPFTLLRSPVRTRSVSHGVTTVRLVQTLACLDRGCTPLSGSRRVLLPPARASSGDASESARAPAITMRPRVPAAAVAAPRARYRRDTSVPPPSTRVPAGLTAAVLSVVAAALAVLAALLVGREVRRRGRHGRQAEGDRLERALRLLRESMQRPAPDRRVASDLAARELSALGGGALADDATRIAWSPADPAPADVETLAERAETAVAGPS
jgi:hypothetical protein